VGGPSAQTRTSNTLTTGGNTLALDYCNILTGQLTGGIFNGYITRTDAVATSFTWTLSGKSANAATQIIPNPDNQHVEVRLKPQGAFATYNLTVGNSCGSFSTDYIFVANAECLLSIVTPPPTEASRNFSISPNPSQGEVSITTTGKNKRNISLTSIYAVKVTDCFGAIQKIFNYKPGTSSIKLSLAGLRNGIYTLSVFDGNIWESKTVMIAK